MAPKSENRQRRQRLTVRFNEQEMEVLLDHADRAGLSPSGYLRHTTLQTKPPRQSHKPVKDAEVLARLLSAIGRIGNNINQLAHVANTGSWPQHQSLEQACDDIGEMRDMLIRALGKEPVKDPMPGHDP